MNIIAWRIWTCLLRFRSPSLKPLRHKDTTKIFCEMGGKWTYSMCSSHLAFSPCISLASMWCIHTVVLTQPQHGRYKDCLKSQISHLTTRNHSYWVGAFLFEELEIRNFWQENLWRNIQKDLGFERCLLRTNMKCLWMIYQNKEELNSYTNCTNTCHMSWKKCKSAEYKRQIKIHRNCVRSLY